MDAAHKQEHAYGEALKPLLRQLVLATLHEMPAEPEDFMAQWLRQYQGASTRASHPSSPSKRRTSAFAAESFEEGKEMLGGKVVELPIHSENLGPVECVLIEPLGKQVAPADFASIGLVVVLHGLPPSDDVIQEWIDVVRATTWLDVGISVAIPNIQMSPALTAADIAAAVEKACEVAGCGGCLLLGKGWGARMAIDLACASALRSKTIEGIVAVAPGLPVPVQISSLRVPLLLLWSQDDAIEPVAAGEQAWAEALEAVQEQASVTIPEIESGGHNLSQMLTANPELALRVRKFTIGAFAVAAIGEAAGQDPTRPSLRSQRSRRLSAELPSFVHSLSTGGERSQADLQARAQEWIESEMVSASE